MPANRFLPLITLLVGAATLPASVGAENPDFVQQQKLNTRARLVSMDAAIAHQEVVLEAVRTLQSEGHASPQEATAAAGKLSALLVERTLIRQLAVSLDTVALAESPMACDLDLIMLPIPFVKDLNNAGSLSHVSYRLQTAELRKAAAKIQSLVEELRLHEGSKMHELLGQRHRRLRELNDRSPSAIRERKLLKLRQTAFNAATVFDHSRLPILVHSQRKYRVRDEVIQSEETLIRLLTENANRLRQATQLSQLQHAAELWEHKAMMLDAIADSGATNQSELDYVRSGADFFRGRTNELRDLTQDGRLLFTSSQEPVSQTVLQAEIQQLSQQHWQEFQQIENKCVSLSGLAEKLKRLAVTDSHFAGELDSVQRSLAIAQAEAAAMAHAEAIQAAAIAFVESQSSTEDAAVMVSSQTTAANLRTLFQLDADKSREFAVLNARIAKAEVSAEAFRELHENGFASWWEAASAEASLQDLRTDLRRLDVVRQISTLAMQIVEEAEAVLPHAEPLAMSR